MYWAGADWWQGDSIESGVESYVLRVACEDARTAASHVKRDQTAILKASAGSYWCGVAGG